MKEGERWAGKAAQKGEGDRRWRERGEDRRGELFLFV